MAQHVDTSTSGEVEIDPQSVTIRQWMDNNDVNLTEDAYQKLQSEAFIKMYVKNNKK